MSALSRCVPPRWDRAHGSQPEVRMVRLPTCSQELRTVQRKILSTLPVAVSRVERVQNPYLWGCYLLTQAEYRARGVKPRELELFHCTSADNIRSISRDNFDWRLTRRSKFGRGVSFSPSAGYANRYANDVIGSGRALILCKVLVGRHTVGREAMVLPPARYDTSVGNGTKVYVKYSDYEFYPEYVAYYNNPPFYDNDDDYHDW